MRADDTRNTDNAKYANVRSLHIAIRVSAAIDVATVAPSRDCRRHRRIGADHTRPRGKPGSLSTPDIPSHHCRELREAAMLVWSEIAHLEVA
jgi:hypothetical protein